MKNPLTPSGIEPAAFRFVAQLCFLQYSVTFLSLTPRDLPQHPISEHPQHTVFHQCERTSYTPIQNNRHHTHTHTHTYIFFSITINCSPRTSLIPSTLPLHISHACYILSPLIRQHFITTRKHNINYLFPETLQICEQPVTCLYNDDFTRNLRPAAFSLSLRFPSSSCWCLTQ